MSKIIPKDPIIEGQLQKQGNDVFKGWKKRYFFLEKKTLRLFYFLSQNQAYHPDVVPIGFIPVKQGED